VSRLAPAPIAVAARAAVAVEAHGGFELPRTAQIGVGGIVQRIGQPTRDALEESRRRLAQLPAAVRGAASNPFSACALMYGLWLIESPELQRAQLGRIAACSGPELQVEAARWANAVGALDHGQRLSLVELAAPALRQLSAEQRLRFVRTIETLTLADRRRSIFEEVVGSMLSERLLGETDSRARARVRHRRLAGVRSELELLLSLLAHAGAVDAASAVHSFAAAQARLPGVELKLLEASEHLINGLGPALAELRALTPELAEQLVDACAHGVLADRRVSADETTLLRAVCDALRCPLPLFDGEMLGA